MSTLGGDGSAAAVSEDIVRLAVAVLPWFLIVFGARRRRVVERIGWGLLVVLFVLAVFS